MQIQIDTEYVARLEARCWSIRGDLESVRLTIGGLDRAPEVAAALDRFDGRWEQNRGRISDGLEELAGALKTIRESFIAMDRELGRSLGSAPGAASRHIATRGSGAEGDA